MLEIVMRYVLNVIGASIRQLSVVPVRTAPPDTVAIASLRQGSG